MSLEPFRTKFAKEVEDEYEEVIDKYMILGDHLKSGHLWSGQNRPLKSWPGLGSFYASDSFLSMQF
jgi:hypothetical protein